MSENMNPRQIAEEKLYKFMDKLDPSGYNSETYRIAFKKMSDKDFFKMCSDIVSKDDMNFSLDVNISDKKENKLDIKKVKRIAEEYNIPLEEYVALPFRNPNGPPMVTMTKVPILYCQIRRFFQQMLQHKNAISNDNSIINPITGQVTGKDKTASTTNVQTYALTVTNQPNSLKEFLGPRADDSVSKAQMLGAINDEGRVYLRDLDILTHNKQSINTVETFMKAAGVEAIFDDNDSVANKRFDYDKPQYVPSRY